MDENTKMVSAEEAQGTLTAMAYLRAAGARSYDVGSRERFARTVIAQAERIAELEARHDHYAREAARLVAVARVAELEAQVARLIRLSETEAAATRANAAAVDARVAELEEIVAGRETAPTDAEIRAHEAVRGGWVVTYTTEFTAPGSTHVAVLHNAFSAWRHIERHVREWGTTRTLRWRAVDTNGAPCAWPKVTP